MEDRWLSLKEITEYLETFHNSATEIKEICRSYRQLLDADRTGHFDCVVDHLCKELQEMTAETLIKPEAVIESLKAAAEVINDYITILQEANWLTEKFGTCGEYADIPGLCKIAEVAEVEEKNWSLTPGAYVGVAAAKDDGVDFEKRMHEIHAELLTLQQQSNELMAQISANFKELGI